MSFFHKIPRKETLRQMALDKAEEYFEENSMSISTLSLLSIILPDKKNLLKYPKVSLEDFKCDDCECDAPLENCILKDDGLKRLDIVRCVFLIYKEGIFIYKPRIEAVKCGYLCFFWAKYAVADDYTTIPESFQFYKWEKRLIQLSKSYFQKTYVDFPVVRIHNRSYVLHSDVSQALLEYQKQFFQVESV
eukprot:snap_masked-scaffold_11-processed-gene-8.6-mRNA-1 protein AED:1.00 eAED:1.00 QI:0/0/0/0/1/1/2/0/189